MDSIRHEVLAEAGALPPPEEDEILDVEVLSEPPEPVDTSEVRGKPRAFEQCTTWNFAIYTLAVGLICLAIVGLALLKFDKNALCFVLNTTGLEQPIDDC